MIDPLLPDPASLTGRGGRPEEHCRRDIVDAIFYLVGNGCKWRALPVDFPPSSRVYNYLAAWERHSRSVKFDLLVAQWPRAVAAGRQDRSRRRQ